MEDIEKRLSESTAACIKSFEAWAKGGKSVETRETLMEMMHEVRKVLSRVEIEIAISERDRLGSRPLPIPPHRSARRGQADDTDGGDDDDNMAGNNGDDGEDAAPRSRRPARGRGRSSGRGGNGNDNAGGNN